MNLKDYFNKPIIYFGHAPSLKLFFDYTEEFTKYDTTWVSLNNLANVKPITDEAGKELDVCLIYCPHLYRNDGFQGTKLTETKGRGSSTQEFLHQLLDAGVKQPVFLFGVDGEVLPGGDAYYIFGTHPDPDGKLRDTQTFNAATELKELEVYNCSIESKIELFPRITVKDALKKLEGFHGLPNV